MFALLHSLTMFVIDFFKSPRRLEVENLFLRHQLTIAMRRAPPRLRLRGSDRALLIWMTRLWPNLRGMARCLLMTQSGRLIRDQARKPTRFAARAAREARVREPHDARCGKTPIRPPSS